MKQIYEARMKAEVDDEMVLFLIGMRVSRWWKLHKWLPVSMAMPKMLRELQEHPELGYLGGEAWFGRTTIMVQYWRSREALYDYARMRDAEHLPAWRKFNRRVGTGGDVGVWHETYVVPQAGISSLYVNMPAFGLGKVAGVQPAGGRRRKPAMAEAA